MQRRLPDGRRAIFKDQPPRFHYPLGFDILLGAHDIVASIYIFGIQPVCVCATRILHGIAFFVGNVIEENMHIRCCRLNSSAQFAIAVQVQIHCTHMINGGIFYQADFFAAADHLNLAVTPAECTLRKGSQTEFSGFHPYDLMHRMPLLGRTGHRIAPSLYRNIRMVNKQIPILHIYIHKRVGLLCDIL